MSSLSSFSDSPELYRVLVEQVKDYAIFLLDAKGNVSSWNQGARQIKGYAADEIIGKHFSIFYTSDALAKDHPVKELAIATQEGRYEEEGWRLRKNGTRFWANVVITALRDEQGNLTGFAKVTRDLTERKREEDALRQKTAELEAFAHTLSHDLRGPVRSVCSFGELLRSDSSLSEKERALYLDKIIRAGESMERMINDILKLSELSLAPVRDDLVSLESVIEECLSLVESEVEASEAQIKIQQPLPMIRGNRTFLVQVFSNLISNALKFVREGQKPQIEIYARIAGDKCEIHVKDFGIGIPEEEQENIFKIFERGEHSYRGSGVGLAIVKRAVERLGGLIAVVSKPGEGSDFIIRMACVEAGAAAN